LRHPAQICGHIFDVVQNLAGDDNVEAPLTARDASRTRYVSHGDDCVGTSPFGSMNGAPADIKPIQLIADTHQICGLMSLCAADFKQSPDAAELAEYDPVRLPKPHLLVGFGEIPRILDPIESIKSFVLIGEINSAQNATSPKAL
jgi:hypothetical protein